MILADHLCVLLARCDLRVLQHYLPVYNGLRVDLLRLTRRLPQTVGLPANRKLEVPHRALGLCLERCLLHVLNGAPLERPVGSSYLQFHLRLLWLVGLAGIVWVGAL